MADTVTEESGQESCWSSSDERSSGNEYSVKMKNEKLPEDEALKELYRKKKKKKKHKRKHKKKKDRTADSSDEEDEKEGEDKKNKEEKKKSNGVIKSNQLLLKVDAILESALSAVEEKNNIKNNSSSKDTKKTVVEDVKKNSNKDNKRTSKTRSRSKDRGESKKHSRSKSREKRKRSRSRDRKRSRSRSRDRKRSRSRSKDRKRSRSRSKDRKRSRSRSRDRKRSRSRSRDRRRSRSRSRDRRRSRSRERRSRRSRSRSKDRRRRSRSRSRSKDRRRRSRSRSRDRRHRSTSRDRRHRSRSKSRNRETVDTKQDIEGPVPSKWDVKETEAMRIVNAETDNVFQKVSALRRSGIEIKYGNTVPGKDARDILNAKAKSSSTSKKERSDPYGKWESVPDGGNRDLNKFTKLCLEISAKDSKYDSHVADSRRSSDDDEAEIHHPFISKPAPMMFPSSSGGYSGSSRSRIAMVEDNTMIIEQFSIKHSCRSSALSTLEGAKFHIISTCFCYVQFLRTSQISAESEYSYTSKLKFDSSLLGLYEIFQP